MKAPHGGDPSADDEKVKEKIMPATVAADDKLERIGGLFGPLAALVAARDGDLFLSAVMAPAVFRDDLFTLFAFRTELERVPFMVSEAMIGEIRLQWWREAIDEIYGNGPVRRHEVAEPLGALIRTKKLPREMFSRFIDSFSADLSEAPEDTLAAMSTRYAEREQAMVDLAMLVAGQKNGSNLGALPKAVGLTRALVNLPRAAAQGRCSIPLEILKETEADPHALFRGDFDARLATAFLQMRDAADTAFKDVASAPRQARSAMLLGPLMLGVLKETQRADFNPFMHDPHPPRFKKQWACWWYLRTGRL
ncbi:MAG: phytoene/squalene synthase family protein [Alphaproteobacteria bacterium]